MDIGTIIELGLIAVVVAAVILYSRKSATEKAALQDQAKAAVDALRNTAEQAIDRLHSSVPAVGPAVTPAPAAQINAGEAIAATVASAPTPAPIAPVAPIPAADVPGMTAAELAGTRPATELDMAAATPTVGGSTWPQTWILADGTRVLAKAPLSPLYRTSLLGTLMGKPIPGGGGHAADPANGDEVSPPLPLRSPAGFPIRYSIAGGAVVGTPTILWGDHSFNSDSEVLDFIRRTLRTPEQEAAAAAAWAASQERLKERVAATVADATRAPGFPPWHPENPANIGKQAIWGGAPGSWGAAREGDAGSLGNTGGNASFYDNVTGNPAWAHPDNPPYRWDGARWVRP